MPALLHVFLLCCYGATAAAVASLLPSWVPGTSAGEGLMAGGLLFLAVALLHECLARCSRQAQFAQELRALRRSHSELEDDLTWTRREVQAVREALEALAHSGRAGAGGALADEVVTEVRLLKTLVGRLAVHAARDADAVQSAAAGRTAAVRAAATPLAAQSRTAGGATLSRPLPAGRALRDGPDQERRGLLSQVREALRDDRIELVLQPVVSLPQRKRRFYECFSRLTAADGSKLVPEQYIALAEQAGLITAIDNMLLFRCIQLVRKIQRKNQSIGFFCNLSLHTLGDDDFFADFVDFLESNAELAPDLVFEFAQDDLAQIGPVASRHLDRLAMLGCRFSLDQVRSLDLDPPELLRRHIRFVKLDAGRFHAEGDDEVHARLRALKARLDASRIDLIVEKIESEETVVALLDYGFDYGQGYLFGEPRLARSEG
jgi:cyclic-di-GMP phosphodiesterase TipF (flagellum assembly factor)